MHYTREEIASWPKGHKKCVECKEILPFTQFAKNKSSILGYRSMCRICRGPEYKRRYAAKTFQETMLVSAKWRASQKGIEIDIDLSDIVIPSVCPILGVPIILERGNDYAPSLDRIDSSKGYTKGNVMVVSKRGNMLKNNMSHGEAVRVAKWLESMSKTGASNEFFVENLH